MFWRKGRFLGVALKNVIGNRGVHLEFRKRKHVRWEARRKGGAELPRRRTLNAEKKR